MTKKAFFIVSVSIFVLLLGIFVVTSTNKPVIESTPFNLETAMVGAEATVGMWYTQTAMAMQPAFTPTLIDTPTMQSTTTEYPTLDMSTPTPSATQCVVMSHWNDYSVQSGDTLYELASKTGSSIDEIMRVNCLPNTTIYIGQTLYLKQALASSAVTPTRTKKPFVTVTHTPTTIPTFTETVAPIPTESPIPTEETPTEETASYPNP